MHSKIILKVVCIAAAAAAGLSVIDRAQATDTTAVSQPVTFDIKPQPLASALNAFAVQSHQQILFTPEVAAGKTSSGITGISAPDAALAQVLAGTGLVSSRSADGMILVTAADAKEASARSDPPRAPSGAISDQDRNRSTSRQDQSTPSAGLEEIVVTAQKRTERLQDVPVPVTALSADSLVETNQLRIQDYYTSVPGLSVTPGDFRGDPILTIRGITTGGSYITSTVGIVIDDIPYGSSTNQSTGSEAIDLDPSDLARVEVLRGPQGTLYGASSIGGLIKYVTVEPSTDALSGHVQVGSDTVHNAGQLGYNVSGSVNVPVTDTFAVRASAFTHQDPGYIDNVLTGQHGVNKGEVDGAHVSALWKPSDVFSVKLGALVQEIKWDGSPYVQPNLGDLNQNTVAGTGSGTKRTQAYSAIVTAKLGVIELTALSGYSINKISDSIDFSPLFGGVGGPTDQLFPGAVGAPDFETLKTTKFSQEIRLSAPIGQRLDWLFGAFYTHESTPWMETTFAADPATGVLIAPIFNDSIQTTYEEYAAFTDLTIHFTDQFDIQVGGRESQNRQTYMEEISGSSLPIVFLSPSPLINPKEVTQDNSFTYLVTPEMKLSSHFMMYARLASGYRNGGPNTTAVLFNLPPHFEPDTTRNYEIGTKGDLFDNTLSFDASVYYIDWQNIQIQTNTPQGATYVGNASRAKSQGVELATNWRPSTGLKIAAWVAWNDAVLTESFPNASPIYGVSGDRLPYSARFSGNLSIQQDFPLWGSASGFVGGAISYVGDRESVFTPKLAPQRQDLPAYTKTDLRAGVKSGSWTTNLYVDNVTDKRGVLSGGLGAFLNYTPMAYTYIQPRTIGVSIAKSF